MRPMVNANTTGYDIQKFYVQPTEKKNLCILHGSENKQGLFPCTLLTDWFLYPRWRVFTARYEMNI